MQLLRQQLLNFDMYLWKFTHLTLSHYTVPWQVLLSPTFCWWKLSHREVTVYMLEGVKQRHLALVHALFVFAFFWIRVLLLSSNYLNLLNTSIIGASHLGRMEKPWIRLPRWASFSHLQFPQIHCALSLGWMFLLPPFTDAPSTVQMSNSRGNLNICSYSWLTVLAFLVLWPTPDMHNFKEERVVLTHSLGDFSPWWDGHCQKDVMEESYSPHGNLDSDSRKKTREKGTGDKVYIQRHAPSDLVGENTHPYSQPVTSAS